MGLRISLFGAAVDGNPVNPAVACDGSTGIVPGANLPRLLQKILEKITPDIFAGIEVR